MPWVVHVAPKQRRCSIRNGHVRAAASDRRGNDALRPRAAAPPVRRLSLPVPTASLGRHDARIVDDLLSQGVVRSTNNPVADYSEYLTARAFGLTLVASSSIRMYGPELLDAFRAFRTAFDPRGRMNPGRLIDARPLDEDLAFGPGYRSSPLGSSRLTFGGGSRSLQIAAEQCVGVGRCRRDDAGVMCPSFRATRDDRYSTRGRAKLLVEMFQGETTPSTWRNEDVRDALDLCLSCKGCAVDCPTHVDMAAYKAEFFSHYYEGRRRPLAMYALGLLPWSARYVARAPWIANAIIGAPGLGKLARRLVGITTARKVPRFAAQPFRRGPVAAAHRDADGATVVLWPDSFTDAFRPGIADDLVAVLEAAGERVAVPSGWACCGRPLYDAGMLGLARRTLVHLLDLLDPWITRGVPIVVPEPSCLSAFRDELPALLADDPRSARLALLARSPAEHLLRSPGFEAALARARAARPEPADSGGCAAAPARAVVHPHCQGRAAGTPAADGELLIRLGYAPQVLDAGCCGLAGSFGYRREHEAISRRIGEEQWLPRVRTAIAARDGDAGAELVVDGYSCEMQLGHLSELESTPLVALARKALRTT